MYKNLKRFIRVSVKKIKFYLSLNFLVKNNKPMPAWSNKRRVVTTTIVTAIILTTSLLIGSIIYGLGRFVHIFESQSIKGIVYENAIKDEQMKQAFLESKDRVYCENKIFKYSVEVPSGVWSRFNNGNEACSQFGIARTDGKGYGGLSFARQPMNKTQAMMVSMNGLNNLVTNSFAHPLYQATILEGKLNNEDVMRVVLLIKDTVVVMAEYTPVDKNQKELVMGMIKSLRSGE